MHLFLKICSTVPHGYPKRYDVSIIIVHIIVICIYSVHVYVRKQSIVAQIQNLGVLMHTNVMKQG